MKLKTFTLRLDPESGTFDDAALQAFLEGREVLSVFEHFFVVDQAPIWAVMVSWREEAPSGRGFVSHHRPPPAAPEDVVEVAPENKGLFEALRRWRNEQARREGRPAYVLFSNRQLAEIANRRPTTRAALQEIPGIGEGRVSAFGEHILSLVRSSAPSVSDPVSSKATFEGSLGPA